MISEEKYRALTTWLAEKILDVSEEADCEPAVLMQSCMWVIGYLLKRSFPKGMRRAVRGGLQAAYRAALAGDVPDFDEPKQVH
jgi:hypothetical protein